MTDNTLFDDDNSSNTPSKYASWTLEDLVKKAENADKHIETLETENHLYKEAKTTTTTIEDLIAKLDQAPITTQNYQPNTPSNHSSEEKHNSGVNKDDVAAMVAAALENQNKTNQAKNNVALVEKKLKENWGENFRKTLNDRASELGVSKDFLGPMAENYPQAFLNLVLNDNKKASDPNTHVAPSNTRRISVDQNLPMSSYRDFSKIMKDNPLLRSDPSFQRKLHEAAEKHGESFFK